MYKYCIKLDYTIKEAIDRIDEGKNRAVLVIDDENRLIGVLSQGDIIRALSYGKSLYSRVDSILHSNFLYLNERDMEEAYRMFKKIKITLLPIVDEEFRLKEVINIDDIFDYLEEK